MRKIAVVGSREGVNREAVEAFVGRLDPEGTVLISGGARGVDTWAAEAAERRGIRTVVIRPNWKKYGRTAGFKRNNDIVLAADDVVAFWDMKSRGTLDTIKKALKFQRHLAVFNELGQLVEHFDMDNLPARPAMTVPKSRRR